MALAGKFSGFRREGDDWFCSSSLPSDLVVAVAEVKFHLHKFPLISRCGKIATMFEESVSRQQTTFNIVLEEFPGGADSFVNIVKFCYGSRVEFTPRNVVVLYCAADYLEMTDNFAEDNLLTKLETFFHGHILKHWKDCVMALQSCEAVLARAEKLRLPSRCINAVSVMICTDPSSFGWPMKMYGSLQSPGGSILWNGISTGVNIRSDESNWWFEDVSFIGVELFERLIHTLERKGVNLKILARAVMYYGTKYLPGLDRWQGEKAGKSRTAAIFNASSSTHNQRILMETVIKLLPERRGKSFCRFLLGLLRIALIMGVANKLRDSLERKVGVQLEFATLDSLLIPNFSESETLYDCDCVERMISHFVSSEVNAYSCSPLSPEQGTSPFSGRLKRVSKLVDGYLAEVASDVNLKPERFRRLAVALPDSSRTLNDGLYRALDIFLKEHSWLSEMDKEQLCSVIDFQKLSVDACAHASQNDRLPIRVMLQVLFFEQMHLRAALASYLNALSSEAAPPAGESRGPVFRQNQGLKTDMDRMVSRIDQLEQDFRKIQDQVKKMSSRHRSAGSPPFTFKGIGCKPFARSSDIKDILERTGKKSSSGL